ncbi:MAG TPA: helix-turn-helix domain-containing protein [Gaiellaceae bacterium]|nr:helix-turn-helix domain-containing protein [Gaiellaceae bacterium]
MASPVGYQTFCPVGAALNVVGERWALLIVRDLILGPRRYSELQKGLGGIPTDILATRLRKLQEQGIVRQVGEGRAQRYELTESGQALGPVLRELGRWGADRLELPADPSEIPTRVPLTSLLLGGAPYPRQANGAYEVHIDDETVRVTVDAGQINAAPDDEPETTIELTRPGMRALIFGARAAEIEQAGELSIRGNRRRAHALLNAVTGPPRLAALREHFDAAAGDASNEPVG